MGRKTKEPEIGQGGALHLLDVPADAAIHRVRTDAGELLQFCVTVTQAAQLLGVSAQLLRSVVDAQSFPAFRLKKRILVDLGGLRRWVHDQARAKARL